MSFIGVGQGETTSPARTGRYKRGVFADTASPEWREVVSGPKSKSFVADKQVQPVLLHNRFEALADPNLQELVSVCHRPVLMGCLKMRQVYLRWLKSWTLHLIPCCRGRRSRR